MKGQKILSQNIDINQTTRSFDLTSYPNGVYLVKVLSNNGKVYTKKVVVE